MTFQEKVDNFTAFLVEAAKRIGCVFYEDSGEGHDLETETMYLEDVSGWLVPIGVDENDAKTENNYRFAEWKRDESGGFVIEFVKH